LSQVPAGQISESLLGRLFRIMRQCAPYRDLVQLRRQALIAQFGVAVAPNGTLQPGKDDTDLERWQQFEAAWLAFLNHCEPLDIDQVPWSEVAAGMEGLTAGIYVSAPCAFVLDEEG